MPNIDLSIYENLAPHELEARRQDLIRAEGTDYNAWSDEALSQMAAIMTCIRKKVSGPPKVAKDPLSTGRKPRASSKASLEDVL